MNENMSEAKNNTMSEKDRLQWTLAEGFENGKPYETRDVSPAFREAREHTPPQYPCIDIAEKLGFDSALAPQERIDTIITPETSRIIYNTALRRTGCPPVLVSMKHSGELVPKIVYDRMIENDMKVFTGSGGGLDTGTVGIFAPRNNETLAVRGRIHRVIIDTNRDATNFEGKWPGFKGVTWMKDLGNSNIYKEGHELTRDEIRQLVEDLYNPFHQALYGLAGTLYDTFGYKEILYIDGHSFPGSVDIPEYKLTADDPKPLILVGTGGHPWEEGKLKPGLQRYGADENVVKTFIDVLKNKIPKELVKGNPLISTLIELNKIFTGTMNIEQWGKKTDAIIPNAPHIGSQAIQVEFNRNAYIADGNYDIEILDILHKAMYEAIFAATEELQKKKRQ